MGDNDVRCLLIPVSSLVADKTQHAADSKRPPTIPIVLTPRGEMTPSHQQGPGCIGTLFRVPVVDRVRASCIHHPLEAH